jgi:hypothetical protein
MMNETQLVSLKKKHQDAVAELTDQLEAVNRTRQK